MACTSSTVQIAAVSVPAESMSADAGGGVGLELSTQAQPSDAVVPKTLVADAADTEPRGMNEEGAEWSRV
jgi:hypothetical protein